MADQETTALVDRAISYSAAARRLVAIREGKEALRAATHVELTQRCKGYVGGRDDRPDEFWGTVAGKEWRVQLAPAEESR